MNAWQIHRSLNAEQLEILKSKTLNANRKADELIAMLTPLASYDKAADKVRTPLGCTMAFCIVAAVVTAFMGIFIAAVILAVLAIVTGIGWGKTKGNDLSNNLRGVAIPLLTVFREDFASDEPVHVELDLAPPTSAKKMTNKSDAYAAGVYYKVIDAFYTDSWMTAEATLKDGSALRWTITDTIRERTKTKRTARGKIKTKTKYSKKSLIEVQVALKKKRYELAEAPENADVKHGEKKETINVYRQVRATSLDPISPRDVIDLVAGVYRNARPVRKEA